jgi:arabinogalactan endo-1,4-beta-galactosidase
MHRRLLVLLITFLAALSPAAAQAATRVPQGFVGMMAGGPLFYPNVNLGGQLDTMVADGVETFRVQFNWAGLQPYKSFGDVPAGQAGGFQNVGGVPTDVSETDKIVTLAAERGLTVLPVVQFAPSWAALHPGELNSAPASTSTYASFVGALAQRYGSRGSFWTANPSVPRVPIRMWQIWNEPESTSAWTSAPWARTYLDLLRASRTAIKAADPSAKIVLAGLANFSWRYLADIYAVHGARNLFDIVGVHPYTAQASGVIEILKNVRNVMNRSGDRHKPILATEVGWPSSRGKVKIYGFETTESGEAKQVASVLPLLARYRQSLGLMGFYYYEWIGDEDPGAWTFDYAGLERYRNQRITAKPALAAFRHGALGLERCSQKARVATRCVRAAR